MSIHKVLTGLVAEMFIKVLAGLVATHLKVGTDDDTAVADKNTEVLTGLSFVDELREKSRRCCQDLDRARQRDEAREGRTQRETLFIGTQFRDLCTSLYSSAATA